MEFLKNHYEKLVLVVVLAAVAVAVFILPMKVPATVEASAAPPASTNAFGPLDLSTNELLLSSLDHLKPADLAWPHNLFNPVIWLRKADKTLTKITNPNGVGLGAIRIDRILPLYFTLTFEGFIADKYKIGVIQETNQNPNLRGKTVAFAKLQEKVDTFRLLSVGPEPENPTEFTVQLNDGKTAVVSKEKPYSAVEGYAVDLTYPLPPGPRSFNQLRVGQNFNFDPSETNKIVDIRSNEVVVSSSSGKRVNLKYKAAQ